MSTAMVPAAPSGRICKKNTCMLSGIVYAYFDENNQKHCKELRVNKVKNYH